MVGFYEDTPKIRSGISRVTLDALTVAESRRNRGRRRARHMTPTGATSNGTPMRHGVNEQARRVQQLLFGDRPCCVEVGGLIAPGARVLSLFGKAAAAAAARSCAWKIDGGVASRQGWRDGAEQGVAEYIHIYRNLLV